MKAYFTRDSVCAGDDGDAPHARQIDLPDGLAVSELVCRIAAEAKLPSISGGLATWAVSSRIPVAVIAQQWAAPRILRSIPPKLSELDVVDGTLRVHFSYFAQQDPDLVFDILRRLQTHAS